MDLFIGLLASLQSKKRSSLHDPRGPQTQMPQSCIFTLEIMPDEALIATSADRRLHVNLLTFTYFC